VHAEVISRKPGAAIFYTFSQFCEIGVSLLSLQKQPKRAPNLFQRGVEYATYDFVSPLPSHASILRFASHHANANQQRKPLQAGEEECAAHILDAAAAMQKDLLTARNKKRETPLHKAWRLEGGVKRHNIQRHNAASCA